MRFEDLLAVSSDANRFCVPVELEVVAGLLEGSVLIIDGVLLTSMLLKGTRLQHGPEAKGEYTSRRDDDFRSQSLQATSDSRLFRR